MIAPIASKFSVDDNDSLEKAPMAELQAIDAYRARKGVIGRAEPSSSSEHLRRRGAENETATETMIADDEKPAVEQDTVLLFAGMPPPALRKAKKEFVQGLQHAVKLANATRRLQAALDHLEGSAHSPPNSPTM